MLTTWCKKQSPSVDRRTTMLERLLAAEGKGLIVKHQLDNTLTQLGWASCTDEDEDAPSSQGDGNKNIPSYFPPKYDDIMAFDCSNDKQQLHEISTLFYLDSLENAATEIFSAPERDIRTEIDIGLKQLMLNILCTWWRLQDGSLEVKKTKATEKLKEIQRQGLITENSLNNILVKLQQ